MFSVIHLSEAIVNNTRLECRVMSPDIKQRSVQVHDYANRNRWNPRRILADIQTAMLQILQIHRKVALNIMKMYNIFLNVRYLHKICHVFLLVT